MVRHFTSFLLIGAVSACATTSSGVTWNDATVSELKVGMTKTEVTSLFGNPTSKSATSTGETLIYRRPSDESRGQNTYLAIVSLGGNTGANATIIDLLEVEIADGAVADFTYSENVSNAFGFGGQN